MNTIGELAKLPAFMRRDLRIMLSYRMAAAADLFGLAAQAVVFSFIGKLVDPSRLPLYGGTRASYLEFVSIGIVFNMVVVLMLSQVGTAIRNEQLIGTLESLLVTPTRVATIQAGSAAFELLWVPVRMALFLVVIAVAFGLDLHVGGILPSVVLLLAFLPFLWGLGLVSAGAILTFRRGAGALAAGGTVLGLASGAFFPLSLLPHWLAAIAKLNPLAIAINGMRETLIGGVGFSSLGSSFAELAPLSIAGLVVGVMIFRFALKRERRLGTLGLY
jgi:ABC-2 type transport system permease protein